MSQDFHGEVAQVAAGNINNNQIEINLASFEVHQPRQLPPAGSDRERYCPQCQQPTWRYTKLCMHCDYDLSRHDELCLIEKERQHIQVMRKRLSTIFLVAGCSGMAILYLKQYLPEPARPWALGGAMLLLAAAVVANKAKDNLGKIGV